MFAWDGDTYVYICIYIYIYIHVLIHIQFVFEHNSSPHTVICLPEMVIHMYIYVYICTYIYMYSYIYNLFLNIICLHIPSYVCLRWWYICIYMYIYVHIYTCTHTYTIFFEHNLSPHTVICLPEMVKHSNRLTHCTNSQNIISLCRVAYNTTI